MTHAAPPSLRHRVPRCANPLFGRQPLLERLCNRLYEVSGLITLTGAPGSGKSRLAAHLAWDWIRRRAPVFWVDLQHATTVVDLEREADRALSASPGGLGRVLTELGTALLVLDNAEQIPVHDISERLAAWGGAAPELRIVVTSRRRVGMRGEHAVDVPGLASEHARSLLAHRAPAGALQGPATGSVERLLVALDGLPLAIRLAASRLEVLGVDELLERMSLDLLADPSRASGRHRSMRAAIDVSWALLSVHEQQALRQAAVFGDAFEAPAAEQVLDLPEGEVRVALEGLQRAHLLARDGAALRVPETVRAYVLAQGPLDTALIERHAATVQRAEGPPRIGEIRAVVARAEQGRVAPSVAQAVGLRGARLLRARGCLAESEALSDRVLALDESDRRPQGRLLGLRARVRLARGDLRGAAEDAERALRIAAATADPDLTAQVRATRAELPLHAHQLEVAAEELAAARTRGAGGLRLLDAEIAVREGRLAAAQGLVTGTAPTSRVVAVWRELGALQVAEAVGDEARARSEGLADRREIARCEGEQGLVAECQGDWKQAQEQLEHAWRALEALGDPAIPYRAAWARACIALGAEAEGLAEIRRALGRATSEVERARLQTTLACVQAVLGVEIVEELPEPARALVHALCGARKAAVAREPAVVAAQLGRAREQVEGWPQLRAFVTGPLTDRVYREIGTWRVCGRGSWIEAPGCGRASVRAGSPNARVLAFLADHRRAAPGVPATSEELFAAGWPGERAVLQARQNRVRVALNALRKAGIRPLLQRQARSGWCLDPEVPLTVVSHEQI